MRNYSTLRHEPISDPVEASEAPTLLVISGTTGNKAWLPYYTPLLDQDKETRISASKRNLHPLKGGFAPIDDVAGDIVEQFDRLHGVHDKKFFVAGHSLGGALATHLALERPDAITGVACLAGAQEGVHPETFLTKALERGLKSRSKILSRYADDMSPDSDFMQKLKTRMAQDWQEDTSLTLYSAPPFADELISAPQGLSAQLPEGQSPERLIVTPNIKLFGKEVTRAALRRFPGMPQDVEILHSRVPADHINIALLKAVKNHVNAKRLQGFDKVGLAA